MQKLIISIIIITSLFFAYPAGAKTLKGGVKYTVKQAREEAFANVEYTLPQSIIKANLTDPNYKENQKAIKLGATELPDRSIGYFSDGGYAIIYKNNKYIVYYYKENGKLYSIEKRESLIAPTKSFDYNVEGKLESITLILSPVDMYIFNLKGELKGHWVGNKCYDKNGKVTAIRY